MDQVKSNFFENQILEAIETVANGIVSKLQFDQTILCTITNDNKRKNGEYEVSNGSSTFKAFSSDTNYKKDMAVYVLVPQGDFERQKTIVGKYVDDTATAINYIPASQSIIEVAKMEIPQDEFSLLANGENKLINIIDSDWNNTNIYDCVSLKANFKTDLSKYNIIDGDYGLMLTLKGYQVKSETKEDGTFAQTIIEMAPKFYKFSCKDMFGDPYNYNIYFDQDIVFDLSKDFADVKINHYRLDFYQNGKFKDLNGNDIPYRDNINDVNFNNNLFVKDIQMSFGYSTVDIKEEGIQIYTPDNLKYIDRLPKKNIVLKWFQKNEVGSNTAYGIIDTLDEAKEKNYSVYWYRYRIGASEDELAGAFWELLDAGAYNDNISYEYELVEDPNGKYTYKDSKLILADSDNMEDKRYRMQIKTTTGTGRYENEISTSNPYNISFAPDKLLNREKIKAILVKYEFEEIQEVDENDSNIVYVTFKLSPKIYESNEIIFENENPASLSLAAVDLIRNMRLECQDGSNGIYKVYNSVDNKALGNEANRIRILNVIFDTYSTIDIPTAELENCSVKWKIPKNNSMIEPVDFSFTGPVIIQNPNNENKIKEDNKSETTIITWKIEDGMPYYECSYSWSSDIVGKDEHYEGVSLQANYRIKEDYSQAYNNNTIICEITKYNRIYKAEIEFLFGESGTNGTGYTLSIRLDKEYDSTGNVSLTPVSCITADTNKKVKLVATLFDQFGNDISDQQTVSWNFKNGINKGLVLDSNYIKYDGTKKDISECYGIVMATSTVKWKEKIINLQAYLPIGIKPKDSDIFTYNGTTKIIYDAQGTQSTYQQIHNLYDKEDKDIPVNKWQVSVLDQGVNEDWSEYIPYFVKEITQNSIETTESSTETTEDSKKTTNILAAKNMYFTELSTKQIVIQALDDKDNVLYQQSILYDQNRFGSALFNEWDGSLIVDEAGNKILSALIGAGKKDNNNTFTGVVMGKTTTNSGLIGYSKGVQTFGFDTDGTAFIGASGKGRIEFNGTTGTIQSGNYKQTKEGIKIDLDDGKFELNPTKILKTDLDGQKEIDFINSLQSAYIQINTNKDPYFEIKTISSINKDENGEYIYETIDGTQYLTYKYTPLISIGKNEYYLQSKNFSDTSTSKTGVKLDLNSGKLYGYDFLIQAGQGDKKLIIDSDSTKPLTIGTNFKVGWDGKIEATGGTFKDITASSGKIGGWTIVSNALYKNISENVEELTEEENKNKLIKYKAVSGSAIIAPSADVTISDLTAFKVWEYTSGDSTQNTPGGSDGPTITTTTEGKWSQSAVTASNIVFSIGKNFAINKDGTIYASGAQLDGIVYKEEVSKLSDTLIKIAQGKLDWETYYRETADNKLDGRIGTVNLNNNGLISQIGEYNGKSIFVDHTIASGRTYIVEGYYGDEKTFYDKTIGYETEISPLSKYQSYYDIDNKQYYKSYDNNTLTSVDKTSADIDKDFVIRGYYYKGKIYQKKKYSKSSSTVSKNSYTIYLDIDTGLAYLYESSKFRLTTPDDNIVMFMVNNKGLLTAANAVIAGTIYAHDGYIGGWTIQHVSNKGGLTYGNNNKKGDFSTNPWEIGDTGANLTPGNGLYVKNSSLFGDSDPIKQCVFNVGQKFAVDTNGVLYASGGTFSGKITANEGAIGNWRINTNALRNIWSGTNSNEQLVSTTLSLNNGINASGYSLSVSGNATINASTYQENPSNFTAKVKKDDINNTVIDINITTTDKKTIIIDNCKLTDILEVYATLTYGSNETNSLPLSAITLAQNNSTSTKIIIPASMKLFWRDLSYPYSSNPNIQMKIYVKKKTSISYNPSTSTEIPTEDIVSQTLFNTSYRNLSFIQRQLVLAFRVSCAEITLLAVNNSNCIETVSGSDYLDSFKLRRNGTMYFKIGGYDITPLEKNGYFHLDLQKIPNKVSVLRVTTNNASSSFEVGTSYNATSNTKLTDQQFTITSSLSGNITKLIFKSTGALYASKGSGSTYLGIKSYPWSKGYINEIIANNITVDQIKSACYVEDSLNQFGRDKAVIRLNGGFGYYCITSITAGKWKGNSKYITSWDLGIDGSSSSENKKYRYCISLSTSNNNYAPLHSFQFVVHSDNSLYFLAKKRLKSTSTSLGAHDDANLGSPTIPWSHTYTNYINTESIVGETLANTSDERLKDLQSSSLLDKILSIYNHLNPVVYKYKNLQKTDNHSRTHVGFIAQEVEQEIINVGLTNEDFAAVQIEQLKNPIPGCEDSKKYYLNYNEFHGLHVLKNQEQDKRILELEQKVQYLENKILELSEKGV